MSLHMLAPEDLAKVYEFNFRLVEVGFVIRTWGKGFTEPEQFFLAKEKDEKTQTVQAVALTQTNVLHLLLGLVPPTVTLKKDQLLNVHPTSITDAMCREREELGARCVACKFGVYQWRKGQVGGVQNYYVDSQGFCRHLSCEDTSINEPCAK